MTTMASSALETSVAPLLEAGAAGLADALGLPVSASIGPADIGDGAFAAAVSFPSAGNGVYVVDPSVLEAVEGAPAVLDDGAGDWVLANILTPMAAGASTVLAQLTGEDVTAPTVAAIDASVADQDGATAVQFTLTIGETGVAGLWAFEDSLLPLLDSSAGDGHSTDEATPDDPTPAPPSVQPATLPELGNGTGNGPERGISMLAAVGVDVTVELGGTRLRMRDLLSLHEGSVVALDQPAGSTVDVLVNGTVIARGDVVVVDNELGVRITEMVDGA